MMKSNAGSVIYVAPANSISIGDGSVEFTFLTTSDELDHCRSMNIEESLGPFGDVLIRLTLCYSMSVGLPALKLRLQQPSGETGFDSLNVPPSLLSVVLEDACLVSQPLRSKTFRESGYGSLENRPEQFFFERGSFPAIITCHGVKFSLMPYLEKWGFCEANMSGKIKLIMDLAQLCEGVMVWSWAYGLNPVLFSVDSKKFLEQLRERIELEGVKINHVDAENLLPEW